MTDILTGVKLCLTVVLIYISLMISDIELLHVPVGHLDVFLRKMSIQSLCPFLNQIACLFEWCEILIFLILTPYEIYDC